MCLAVRPTPCPRHGLRRGTATSLQQDPGQPLVETQLRYLRAIGAIGPADLHPQDCRVASGRGARALLRELPDAARSRSATRGRPWRALPRRTASTRRSVSPRRPPWLGEAEGEREGAEPAGQANRSWRAPHRAPKRRVAKGAHWNPPRSGHRHELREPEAFVRLIAGRPPTEPTFGGVRLVPGFQFSSHPSADGESRSGARLKGMSHDDASSGAHRAYGVAARHDVAGTGLRDPLARRLSRHRLGIVADQ
jgi:hypothetical protein